MYLNVSLCAIREYENKERGEKYVGPISVKRICCNILAELAELVDAQDLKD